MAPRRLVVILIADVGLLAWAAMAALAPERLPGPGSTPILTAGYEGFTGGSWQDLVATSPKTAEYTTLLFRMYGIYGVALSLLAIAIALPPRRAVGMVGAAGREHDRLRRGDGVRPGRGSRRTVRVVGIPRPRRDLRVPRHHSSLPRDLVS
jgi:hypothetical protein